MAQNRMTQQALLDHLDGADTDLLRRVLEHAMQRLIDAKPAAHIGAGPHERASTRTTYRNGHRERILDTGSGRLELQIPKLRSGSFFPSLLEPRSPAGGETSVRNSAFGGAARPPYVIGPYMSIAHGFQRG
jgi:putative transposase